MPNPLISAAQFPCIPAFARTLTLDGVGIIQRKLIPVLGLSANQGLNLGTWRLVWFVLVCAVGVLFTLVARENCLRMVYDPSRLVDVSALAVQENWCDAS